MTLLFLKTHDLSWQDRTLNIELMMAPSRSQLLYNKHKGLSSKCQQEHSYLDREKNSYLRSYKTDKRLMEMRKAVYDKKKVVIHQRRMSIDKRSKSPSSGINYGRNSAPPRLQQNPAKDEHTFLTKIGGREAKSAETGVQPSRSPRGVPSNLVILSPRSQFTVPATVTSGTSRPTRGPVFQPPFLERTERQKSVRFLHDTADVDQTDKSEEMGTERLGPPVEDRIKMFLEQQLDFNKRQAEKLRVTPSPGSTTSSVAKRYTELKLKVSELEKAFDSFCGNTTDEGYHSLIRYAAKMKANVKNARNMSLVPTVGSLKGSKIFKGMQMPNSWTTAIR